MIFTTTETPETPKTQTQHPSRTRITSDDQFVGLAAETGSTGAAASLRADGFPPLRLELEVPGGLSSGGRQVRAC